MNIHLTALDFSLLRNNDMAWADIVRHYPDPLERRFEFLSQYGDARKRMILGYAWKRIYWFGHEYAAVVLAKTYLEATGEDYEILLDKAHEWDADKTFGYVILTDYEREEK